MEAVQSGFVEIPQLHGVSRIVVSLIEAQACALADGIVYCWGDRWADGPLGAAGAARASGSAVPEQVPGLPVIVRLSAGMAHACALSVAGEVYCWGDNAFGAIVDPARDRRRILPPTNAGGAIEPRRYVDVLAAPNQTCALTARGEMYCWGGAVPGKDGRPTAAFTPTLVATSVARMRCDAAYRVCAVSRYGVERCWRDTVNDVDPAYEARQQAVPGAGSGAATP